MDDEATIFSVDGVGAYDSIPRLWAAQNIGVKAQLKESERLFLFLDHMQVVCPFEVGEVYTILEKALREMTGMNIQAKKLWNKVGIKPSRTDALTCAARAVNQRLYCGKAIRL